MKTSDALRFILNEPANQPLPNGVEADVSTNVPLAIAMAARAICERLGHLETAISFLTQEVSALRKGYKS